MKLSQLLKKCNIDYTEKDVEVHGIVFDSRKVKHNDIFVAIKGNLDGNDYVSQAVDNGACLIISEENIDYNVPKVVVENSRKMLSTLSKHFYGDCCDKLNIIMVTGTNGKTSITYILQSILSTSGINCAIMGTNGVIVGNRQLYYGLTTPDPVDMHYYFKVFYDMGVTHVIMETSAHAIALHKVDGITPKAIIYTNLTNEHLDYFHTMQEYSHTKIDYINSLDCIKIINIDDTYSRYIVGDEVVSYGLINPSDTFAINIENSIAGLKFCANVMDNIINISSRLCGLYNVYNIMASITCAVCLNIDIPSIEKGVNNLLNIPGRFNKYLLDLNRIVVVDFAHTPDGFEKVLSEIKSFRSGRIITVFGCVGYSDSNKRKLMGEIASKFSDEIILTVDNINYQNFNIVNKDIKTNINVPVKEIFDRKVAIKYGFEQMKANDTLVILGKGCETSNLINGVKVPHNDIEEVEHNIEIQYNVKKGAGIEDIIV